MRNKLYIVFPASATEAVLSAVLAERKECHTHSIPPDHAMVLGVVIAPPAALEASLSAKYLALPELHDHTEHLTQAHVDAFPASVGLTTADTTYSAMRKVHDTLGMAAMHPKS